MGKKCNKKQHKRKNPYLQKFVIDLFLITFTFSARFFLKEKIRARNENTLFFIVIIT